MAQEAVSDVAPPFTQPRLGTPSEATPSEGRTPRSSVLAGFCADLLRTSRAAQCVEVMEAAVYYNGGQPVISKKDAERLLPLAARAATPRLAVQLLAQLPPAPRLYHRMMLEYGRAGNVSGVGALASAVEECSPRLAKAAPGGAAGVQRHTLVQAILAYGVARRPDLARQVFGAAVGAGRWDPVTGAAAANALINAHADDMAEALDRYNEVVALGLQPCTTTFNTLLKAAMRSRDYAAGIRIRRLMREQGVPGDSYTFNTLVKVFSYSGEVERLPDLYAELQAQWRAQQQLAAAAAVSPSSSSSPSSLATAAATSAAERGVSAAALRQRRQRRRQQQHGRGSAPDELQAYVWGSFITAYGKAGRTEDALAVWADLQRATTTTSATTATTTTATKTTSTITHALPADGFGNSSGNPVGSGGGGGVRASGPWATTDECNAAMNACVWATQCERALSLFDSMPGWGLERDLVSFNVAIKACGCCQGRSLRRHELDRALGVLDAMRQQEGVHPDCVTYTTLFTLCAQANEGGLAWRLWCDDVQAAAGQPRHASPSPPATSRRETTSSSGSGLSGGRPPVLRPDTGMVTALISALGSSGMVQEALTVFRGVVWGPSRSRATRATYLAMCRAAREAGELDTAFEVYQGMREAGHAPDNREFNRLMAAFADSALVSAEEGAAAASAGQQLERPPAVCATFLSGTGPLDLHGLSTREARAAVLCVVSALAWHYRGRGLGSDAAQGSLGLGTDAAAAGQDHYDGSGVAADVAATMARGRTAPGRSGGRATAAAAAVAAGSRSASPKAGRASEEEEQGSWEQGQGQVPFVERDLVIITGAGRNSGAHGPRLREEIARLLEQELGIRIESAARKQQKPQATQQQQQQQGTATAAAEAAAADSGINKGRLVVTREALAAWLAARDNEQGLGVRGGLGV